MFNDTIAAISTPLAKGAISIVRLSGPDAMTIAQKIFDKPITKEYANTIRYGTIQDNGQPIDEVLLSVFAAPHSYTAENMVEINCHGGTIVTRHILRLLLENGARLARPGEFTERAFLHGRIDLAQAEAVMDLVDADSEAAASLAIQGLKGSVRKLLEPLVDQLLAIIAQIEVNVDYPEYEDIEQLTQQQLLPQIKDWLQQLDAILEQARNGRQVKEGINTVILGKPNAGKSSLLNALLEEEKAIVTDIPGTTRDIVEGTIQLHGYRLNLLDTAGIRHSTDQIEQIGIEKSRQALEQADLILLVLEAGTEPDPQEQELLEKTKDKNRILVYNKTDLAPAKEGQVSICAKDGNVQQLLDRLETLYDTGRLDKPPLLSNERQIGLLQNARMSMMNAYKALQAGIEPDLAEIDLQEAHTALKEIFGNVSRDDLLDTLFSRFCLGK